MPRSEQQLETLHEQIKVCTACPLHLSRSNAVPGEGGLKTELMLIGEAPGAREDELGRPFCGRAGAYLDRLFEEIDLDRGEVYITSTVKCRPPENRTPNAKELETCGALWLNRQIELVDPAVVILLGRIPTGYVLGEKGTMRDLHGQTRQLDHRLFVPTYHPAAAMRFPEPEKGIREDFKVIHSLLSNTVTQRMSRDPR